MARLFSCTCLLVVLASLSYSHALGQVQERPVFLALSDQLPSPDDERFLGGRDVLAVLFWYSGGLGAGDVVVLQGEDANPHALRTALAVLAQLNEQNALVGGRMFSVPDLPAPTIARQRAVAEWAHVAAELRTAPRVELEGFGLVRWLPLAGGS